MATDIESTSLHGTDLQCPNGHRKEELALSQASETYSAGILDGSDYGALSGFSKDAGTVSEAEWPAQIPPHRQKRVIIVGAGVSGIQQASVLLRDGHLRLEDIQIFDALDNYGGVWNKNKYPGCACDVPAMIYTTSYYVNKSIFNSSSRLILADRRIEWTNFFATQPQIESYYTEFAKTYGLERCTQFQSFVQSCVWDGEQFKWRVQIQDKVTGEIQHWLGDYICQCVGALDRPKFGTTPGREKFKGTSWHTAHWNHDYNLKGKNVAIIGCGPSAAQVIPEIIDVVGHLTVYMRNPPVCVPRNDFQYSK
jgi:cation diffusion facilitator CzcD-associated flavoprotein CzcO